MIGESNCTLQCAILAVSKEVLRSGFEDLLMSSCASGILSTRCLCQLGAFAVYHQTENIMQTVLARKQNANGNQCATVAVDQSITSVSDNALLNSRIAKGQYGRMLSATNDTKRGTVLLRERPYVCCSLSGCGCSDGPILIEHLCITTALQYCPERNDEKFTIFKEQLFSGLVFSDGKERREGGSDLVGQWSVHTQCLMCVACAITALLRLRRDAVTVDRTTLASEAWELVQILARIPANLHAITEVVATPCNQDRGTFVNSVVRQSRMGFGLFLAASAANHSCVPNSAVRFAQMSICARVLGGGEPGHFTTIDVSGIFASSTTRRNSDLGYNQNAALARLMGTVVEVAATADISSGHEVTVSYGPMRGSHSLAARRECLRRQYLFHCDCAGCVAEGESQVGHNVVSSLSAADCDLSEVSQMLGRLDAAVYRLGGELSALMDAGDVNAIVRFERERLMLVDRHLQQLRLEYFPSDDDLSYSTAVADTRSTSHRSLFAHFSRVFCALADLRAHALATAGELSPAIDLVSAAIALMVSSGQHSGSDVVVGRERVKLAALQLSAGEVSACRMTAIRAARDLQPFVGPSDPDWIEVTNILELIKTREQ